MKVTYRVFDTRTNEDITDKYCWVIRPDGKLVYCNYGDLIGLTYARYTVIIDPEEDVNAR